MPGAQSDMEALNRIRKASHTDVARLQPHGYARAHRLITTAAPVLLAARAKDDWMAGVEDSISLRFWRCRAAVAAFERCNPPL
jgi:hypothetical protein